MLSQAFFDRPAPLVAPELIGKKLVRLQNGKRLAGIITETEAYQGQEDSACHAHVGKTKRNEVMFGRAATAYIYFTYGMHWLLNIVTDLPDMPAAVLIRAVFPVEGLELMAENRPMLADSQKWLNGPAKLTQGFGLTGALNGQDMLRPESEIFIEEGLILPQSLIQSSPRIGLGKTPEPWLSMPWRWEISWQEAYNRVNKENL